MYHQSEEAFCKMGKPMDDLWNDSDGWNLSNPDRADSKELIQVFDDLEDSDQHFRSQRLIRRGGLHLIRQLNEFISAVSSRYFTMRIHEIDLPELVSFEALKDEISWEIQERTAA